jgi:RND family efflux transporter MFP subunit
MRRSRILFGCMLAAAILGGCSPDQPFFGPREVDVTTARRQVAPELVDVPALLAATARVEVKARTTGYLLERTFEDGTEVEQNRVLFVLQSDEYRAAAESARAKAEAAEAALAAHRESPGTTEPGERPETAGDAGAEGAERVPTPEETARITDLRAQLATAREGLVRAETNLAYTTLRAPIDGRIDSHPIDVGNLVEPGDLLATIVQTDPIFARFEVTPDQLLRIQEAQRREPVITAIVDAAGRVQPLFGRIDVIGTERKPSSGGIEVRAVIPNLSMELYAGQEVTARLLLDWYNAILVPPRAIAMHDGKPVVFVVDAKGRVERRPVTAGARYGNMQMVHDGLEEGESIVWGRINEAVDGRIVRPVDRSPEPGPVPSLPPYILPPPELFRPLGASAPSVPPPLKVQKAAEPTPPPQAPGEANPPANP